MFQITLTDFRCFAEAPPIEVRPITFLVGENSAGKTSFMAAARILFETFQPSVQIINPFNAEPYFLGGYDQIAHYRGGPRGRAKKFSLAITVLPTADEPKSRKRQRTEHKFTYARGSPQPQLDEYEFVLPEAKATVILGQDSVLKINEGGREVFAIKPERPPFFVPHQDPRYIHYVLQELIYGRDRPGETRRELRPELKTLAGRLLHEFRLSVNALERDVFASAPVRTHPRRTYTPSEITPSAEGEHVPLEMARQRIASPADWLVVHDKLSQFGRDSGLFDDIDIRMLGKKEGDPFQLTVKTGGPSMNIVDVGYGVSQALPIIYQLEQAKQYDTFLLQQPEVHLHPRAQAELGTLIARISTQRPEALHIIETHSDYIIDRLRMEVADGRLSPKMITIVFFDRLEHRVQPTNIYLSEKGDLLDAPYNFRAFFLKEQQRLLGL